MKSFDLRIVFSRKKNTIFLRDKSLESQKLTPTELLLADKIHTDQSLPTQKSGQVQAPSPSGICSPVGVRGWREDVHLS